MYYHCKFYTTVLSAHLNCHFPIPPDAIQSKYPDHKPPLINSTPIPDAKNLEGKKSTKYMNPDKMCTRFVYHLKSVSWRWTQKGLCFLILKIKLELCNFIFLPLSNTQYGLEVCHPEILHFMGVNYNTGIYTYCPT